jgi:hypothetical protein
MGTPAYFPPEVSQGLAEPDERSDAYSFAVMSYEALTGLRPYYAPDALSLVTAHATGEPLPATEALPGFPEAAWRLLRRGMDKDPGRRLSPGELVSRLAALPASSWPLVRRHSPAGAGTASSDPTLPAPGVRSSGEAESTARAVLRRRRRLGRWPALALVATGLVAAVGAWFVWTRSPALEVTSLQVEVDPTSGTASCPEGDFVFTAVLSTNGSPGTLRLQWVQPDGVTTRTVGVEVGRGQLEVRAELPFSVRGTAPVEGSAEIRVLSPQPLSASRAMRYECARP